MSKVFIPLLASALCALMPSYAQEDRANDFEPFTGYVNASHVRIRAKPSLEGHVVRESGQGELLAITREENGFYAVVPAKGTKGYVFRTFVLDGVIEGERVNVRLYPDADAPIIGRLQRGTPVESSVCAANNKWLEIDLPQDCCFYIAKEFIEKKGPLSLIAEMEKKQHEASHMLRATVFYAQGEMQKPFSEIDIEGLEKKFLSLEEKYGDLPEIVRKAQEAHSLFQDICVHKKIAFLEGKNEIVASPDLDAKLQEWGFSLPTPPKAMAVAEATSTVLGLSLPQNDLTFTDRMRVWQPLEEALYHLWASVRKDASTEQFYTEEREHATLLTGIVEPYTRPVKNRPGDFLLRQDHIPVAFLYSTRVNLDKLVGKQITVWATPRPNNSFAFPAYYVLSVE